MDKSSQCERLERELADTGVLFVLQRFLTISLESTLKEKQKQLAEMDSARGSQVVSAQQLHHQMEEMKEETRQARERIERLLTENSGLTGISSLYEVFLILFRAEFFDF